MRVTAVPKFNLVPVLSNFLQKLVVKLLFGVLVQVKPSLAEPLSAVVVWRRRKLFVVFFQELLLVTNVPRQWLFWTVVVSL
jgi:hypothetical protein